MGFSLKMFFEELEDILNTPDLNSCSALVKLREVIEWNKNYAKECGDLV